MIALLSTADATVVVAIIALVSTFIAIRTRQDVKQINKAVNHVAEGEPTLIQRVRDIQRDNHEFRLWTHESMFRIAKEVGAHLNRPPAQRGHDGSDEAPSAGDTP